jgi:type II secretory pathway component PulF
MEMALTGIKTSFKLPSLKRVSVKEKAFFARQLSVMLASGIQLAQALDILNRQTKNEYFKEIVESMRQDLNKGISFSGTLGKHQNVFGLVFLNVVRSGEASGNLEKVLHDLADQLEAEDRFISNIRGALIYPIFIFVVMVFVAILMAVKVIPQLRGVFEESGAQLPWSTQVLFWISSLLITKWWVIIGVLAGIVVFLRWYFTTEGGILLWGNFQIKNPTGLGLNVFMARFARTMGMLAGAGVPIIEAVSITSEVMGNELYRRDLNEVVQELERGIPMSVPLSKSPHFPVLVSQMMTVGEQTGKLDEILENLAKYYETEAEDRVRNLSKIFEPALIVFMGLGVAFIVFSILLPIYNIAQLQ